MNWNKLTKRTGALALCAALTVGAFTLPAGAQGVTAQLSPNLSIVVDGTARTFYNVSGTEVHPIAYNGTTYLPIRAIGELMGKNVNWDQSTLTVSLSGTRTTGAVTGTPDTAAVTQNVTADVRSDVTILVDGVRQSFTDVNGNAVYPLIYNGSVYLPIRAIGNLMGKTVSWDSATSTVTLGGELLVTDADSFNNTGAGQNNQNTQNTQTSSNGLITEAEAQSKALTHAGLSESQVSFVRCHLDWDDGRQVYDVEFYTSDYKEYDYEIDAYTGAVLSYDYDADFYTPPTSSGSYIGLDRAKEIALAKVSGATSANIRRAYQDRDDGRVTYEIEIRYNLRDYEFEIDASTGAILDWDSESIYD